MRDSPNGNSYRSDSPDSQSPRERNYQTKSSYLQKIREKERENRDYKSREKYSGKNCYSCVADFILHNLHERLQTASLIVLQNILCYVSVYCWCFHCSLKVTVPVVFTTLVMHTFYNLCVCYETSHRANFCPCYSLCD